MNESKLKKMLDEWRRLPSANEWVEFKEAKNKFNMDDIGKYFSALSNEAKLKGQNFGWLVFGVEDENKDIVGSQYRMGRASLDKLKQEIAEHTTSRLTFVEIHEFQYEEKRVIVFQIPPALRGIPTAWKGHYYGRNGGSIGALSLHELEVIRSESKDDDWSKGICEGATIDDLEPEAIKVARERYKVKNPKLTNDVDDWDDITFLNKAKIIINGKITRTAMILLGKDESSYKLSAVVQITWILKDRDGLEIDYEHFSMPLLLTADEVFSKIRNLNYRYMTGETIFPIEITQYDPYVIREALHNCIAHQDYELKGRINIVENPEHLIFSNVGNFIPKTIRNAIERDAPSEFYRNKLLTQAMVNLSMIDTIGSGIKKMFLTQRKRNFPMLDYELSEADKIIVRITGKIIDLNYSKILHERDDLDLNDVILLDKVQKNKPITLKESHMLRERKLIEGRYPNIYVSSGIAAIENEKAAYIRNRALDKGYYKKLILDFIDEYGFATRSDIDSLLMSKLSDTLNIEKKRRKIKNLIYEMANKDLTIKNDGTSRKSRWIKNNQ